MEYNYIYNRRKYIELLEYNKVLQERNKLLKEQNELKYLELRNYSRQINDHLHWYKKNEYSRLIEDFLNFKINGKTFETSFSDMVEKIEKECNLLTQNYEMLKNIEPSPISFEFAEWISEIYLYCDEFYSDFDENDPPDFIFAMNEKDFRTAVDNIFPKIQKY